MAIVFMDPGLAGRGACKLLNKVTTVCAINKAHLSDGPTNSSQTTSPPHPSGFMLAMAHPARYRKEWHARPDRTRPPHAPNPRGGSASLGSVDQRRLLGPPQGFHNRRNLPVPVVHLVRHRQHRHKRESAQELRAGTLADKAHRQDRREDEQCEASEPREADHP